METMVQKIQRRRLQWFGHVKCTNYSRLPAIALTLDIRSGYKKPEKSWLDGVKKDLHQRK